MLGERSGERFRHGISGRFQGRGRVAAGDMAGLAEVAFAMHLRGVRGHGFLNGSDGGEDFVFDFDLLFCFLQNFFRLRGDEADGVAHAAGDVADGNHDVPILLQMANLIIRHVRRRKDADDALHGEGFPGVDGQHPGPGML